MALKLKRSAILYPVERDKIEYILLRTEDIAFSRIAPRCSPTHPYLYRYHQEVIDNLRAYFGIIDALDRAEREMQNLR